MRVRSLIFSVWLVLVAGSALGEDANPARSASASFQVAPLTVVASLLPLQRLVEDLTHGVLPVQVSTLLPANATPHDFSLSPQRVQALRSADWVIWLGDDAEPYLVHAMRQSDGRQLAVLSLPNVQTRYTNDASDAHHDHAGHQHEAGALDPHLWWDADNLNLLATAWVSAVAVDYPAQAEALHARLTHWREQLQTVRDTYRARFQGRRLLALSYHEAFGYLADDLGVPLDLTLMRSPELKPGARQVLHVRQQIAKQQLLCLLMEPAAQPNWLQLVDPDQRLKRVVIDPLGWDILPAANWTQAYLRSAYGKLAPCLEPATTSE